MRSMRQKGMLSHSSGCSCGFSSGCFKASRYSLLISQRISPWSCRCWMRRCCSLNQPVSSSRVATWSSRESICAMSDSMECSFWKESISQESFTCCFSTRLLQSPSWNFKNLKLSLSRMKGFDVSDTFSRKGCGLLYSTSRLQYSRHFYIIYVFVGGTFIQFYSIKLHYRHYHHRGSYRLITPHSNIASSREHHHQSLQWMVAVVVVIVPIYDDGSG